MTSSYTPTPVSQGYGQETAINQNFTDLKIALDEALTRVSSVANAMESDLDMATNKVLNSPEPNDPLDLVRLTDINSLAVQEVVDTITFDTSLSIDISAITFGIITLADNTTITFTGAETDGQVILLRLNQGGAGSYTVTWANGAFSSDLPEPTLSTVVGESDYLVFRYNAVSGNYDHMAINRGFS